MDYVHGGIWDCVSEKTGMYAEQLRGRLGEMIVSVSGIPQLRIFDGSELEVACMAPAPVCVTTPSLKELEGVLQVCPQEEVERC